MKILCGCGQEYAFDVEPIGGRIAHAVQCPVCGSDGTLAANQTIAEHLALNSAPVSGLRIGGQQRPATVPLPPRIPITATRESNSFGVKIRSKWPVLALGGELAPSTVFRRRMRFT